MSDGVVVVVAVISLVGTLGTAIIQNWEKIFPKERFPHGQGDERGRYKATVIVALVGASLTAGGLYFNTTITIAPQPTPEVTARPTPIPNALIKIPTAGARVSSPVIVEGTATGIPSDHRLWILVNPDNNTGWWPQNGAVTPLPPAGKWKGSASLGGLGKFTVALVMTTEEVHREFQNYLEQGTRTRDFPGHPLPTGTEILASVEVVNGN